MQIKKLAPSLMESWIRIYEEERPRLRPNAITGEALAAYLAEYCAAQPSDDETVLHAVCDAVQSNAFFRAKLAEGKTVRPAAFVCDDGTAIGIDLETGYFLVDGDAKLRDVLTYVKGVDEADLDNVIRTVDWLRCKKLFEKKLAR